MFKWVNTAQLQISEIKEIQIYGQWGMAVLHTEALIFIDLYRSADKSLARPTSWFILFDGENISFDASL